jgi:hypothetical protein
MDGEKQNHQDAAKKGGHTLPGEDHGLEKAFRQCSPLQRHEYPDGQPQAERKQHGSGCELQRVGDAREQDIPYRHTLHIGHPQIECAEIFEIAQVLHEQGLIKAQAGAEHGNILGGSALGDQQQGGIACKPLDKKQQGQGAKGGDKGLPTAF